MTDNTSWLGLSFSAWMAAVIGLLLALCFATVRDARQEPGWHNLTRSVVLDRAGPFWSIMLFLTLPCIVAGVVRFEGMAAQGHVDFELIVLLLLLLPLCAYAGYATLYLVAVRVRFNRDGVEGSFFGHIVFIPWSDVESVERHLPFGWLVTARNGRRPILVWKSLSGFDEMVEMAAEHGVPVIDY